MSPDVLMSPVNKVVSLEKACLVPDYNTLAYRKFKKTSLRNPITSQTEQF